MRRRISGVQLGVAFITVTLLLMGQLCGIPGWTGPACVRSLTESTEGAHPFRSGVDYGWPLRYRAVATEGCFERWMTHAEWSVERLAINSLVFLGLGTILELTVLLWRRLRHGGAAKEAT